MGIGDSGGWGIHESKSLPKIKPQRKLVEIVLDGSADRVLIPTEEHGIYETWERVNSEKTTRIGSYEIPGTYKFSHYIRR